MTDRQIEKFEVQNIRKCEKTSFEREVLCSPPGTQKRANRVHQLTRFFSVRDPGVPEKGKV